MANAINENNSNFIKAKPRARAAFLIKATVSVSILVYLAYAIDWSTLLEKLAKVQLGYFSVAIIMMAFPIILTCARWQILLRAQNIVIPIRKVLSFDLIALFFNSFLPGSTGGDAARVYYAIRMFPNEKTRIVLSIITDRGIGLIVLLALGFGALQLQRELFQDIEAAQILNRALPALLFACLSGLLLLFFLPSLKNVRLFQRARESLPNHALIQNGVRFTKDLAKRPGVILLTVGISAVSYLFNFASGYLVSVSLGLSMSFAQVVVVLAVLYTIISLPISISGHGVRELTLIALFTAFGMATVDVKEVAIAFSILLYAIQLFWSLVGGSYYVTHRSQ